MSLAPVASGSDPGLGQAAACAMVFPHRPVVETALELLEPAPEDAILELGFGTGRLLAALAARARRGLVVGVDPSEWMLRHARRRCARPLGQGRLTLVSGSTADLSALAGRRFDKAVGVHVAGLFADPQAELASVARLLRPGGRLVLGFRPGAPGEGPETARPGEPIPVDADRLARDLRRAGFEELCRSLREAGGRPLLWMQARRAARLPGEEVAA